MFLKKILLDQYRNISSAEFEPARNLTILYGLNGQGKTNILESIYFLGNARPFRNVRVSDLIQHTSKTAAVRGMMQSSGVNSEVCINLENSARRVYIDGKAIHRSTDLHGKLAVVIFSPDDTAMVKLGPETRRRFLDRSLYTSNIGFLQDYHCYYRNLKQRNSLLKNNQTEGLDIWTEQMATSGARLMKHRQRYTAKINTLLQNHYKQIAGQSENVEICYLPDLTPTTDENMNEHLLKAFREHQEYDIRSKTTGRGPHRDDLGFILQERSLKKFGSQGQQRSYILALKMAELEYLHETFGEMPVLLLDDIASELDRERMSKLLRYIRQKEIQVVITTTDINPFLPMIEKDSVLMKVEEGRLIKEGNRIS